MADIKIHEQLAHLRKQRGLTQEDIAQKFGVTNQSVSKWESGVCCPDIALLPDIADYFDVSVDELLGYTKADNFKNIFDKIKKLFLFTPATECLDLAYKLSALLHEGGHIKGLQRLSSVG